MDSQDNMKLTQPPLGLKELIAQIKKDIIEHELPELFYVKQVDLEISFSVEWDADAGFRISVVQLGGKRIATHLHTVKLTLEPIMTIEQVREAADTSYNEVLRDSVHRNWPVTVPAVQTKLVVGKKVRPTTIGAAPVTKQNLAQHSSHRLMREKPSR